MRVKCRDKKANSIENNNNGRRAFNSFSCPFRHNFRGIGFFSPHTSVSLLFIPFVPNFYGLHSLFIVGYVYALEHFNSTNIGHTVESSSCSCSPISNSLIVRLSLSLTYCDGANNLNIGTTFVPNSRSIHIGMQHIECQEITHNSPQSDYIFYLNWQASTFFQITTLFDRRNRLALWILQWIALDCGIIVNVRVGRWSFRNPLVVICFLFVWQHPWTVKKSRTERCCFQSRSEMDLNRQYWSNPSGTNFRSLFNAHPVKHLNITLPSLNASNFVALVEMLKWKLFVAKL